MTMTPAKPAVIPSATPQATDTPAGRQPVAREIRRPTRTKVIATIGPASESPETVSRLIEAGVNIFRFNFSHGTFEEHGERLAIVRKAAEALGRPVACLGDLSGPKIRVTQVPGDGFTVEAGEDVVIRRGVAETFEEQHGEVKRLVIGCTYEPMIDEVEPGQRRLVNDGAIRMLAVERTADELVCRVTAGGLITSKKGINLPETEMSVDAMTAHDWRCVEWAVGQGMDMLALSFVRRPEDILELKRRLAELCSIDRSSSDEQGSEIPIVAKVEKPQAVARIDEIVAVADAIMIARGDLGVEMDIAEVPVVQKRIARACHEWGKPCIVATQMLETMIDNASPTRAEATDVANAIYDGADAVMLSGETAVGRHPTLVVETMRRICAETEADLVARSRPLEAPARLADSRYPTAALAHGASYVARDINARLLVCWSENGGTARYLANFDAGRPSIACSSSARATRRMLLLAGVTPVHMQPPEDGTLAAWNRAIDAMMLELGWAEAGDAVLLLAGKPLGVTKVTNSLAIHYVGDPGSGYLGSEVSQSEHPAR